MPLTHGHVQVLRYLPSLLWRLEFVALMQEMTQRCDGLLQMALPSALGEAMTHSQVLSLPFHPPGTRRFCYERMELMGDAVLKLMACAHAAAALPRANEGQLSSVAQWCETNKWLRKVNEKTINVGSFLLLHGFRPKTRLSKLRQNRVPQKVAADAVEVQTRLLPIAGCLGSGLQLHEWGFDGASIPGGCFCTSLASIRCEADAKEDTQDAVLAELHLRGAVPVQFTDTTDANAAEEVEKAFGNSSDIAFVACLQSLRGNRTLLRTLRAEVTGARRNGFQRLEFLGDAVLLVAVCCHIMQEYPDFDEGKLSETLHAFVCNSYLSRKLIRRFGQAQSLASVFFPEQSPQRALLPGYVETVLASEAGTDYVIGQASEAQALPSRLKFVADSYEALIAAVLLDTGGDMDETWAVFAKDFELPKSQVTEKIRAWHDHLQSAEKQEVGLESGEQLVEDVPEFDKLPEGEGRKRLLDYCRRQGVKVRFEAVPAEETSGEVRMRCVVGGRSLPEANGVSMKHAQDVAAEKALWELLRLPDRKPETKHEGLSDAEMPSQSLQAAPASQVDDLSLQRPKGVARQDLLRYCQRKGLQQRFLEDEEEDETNATTYCVRAKVEEIVYPEARAKNKGAAQDMAAELALLELRGPDEEVQNSQVSEGAETERGPASQAAMVLQRAPEDFSLDSLPSARPKGVDRQELQSHCSRAKLNLAFKEEVSGQSHCPTFRVREAYPTCFRKVTKSDNRETAAATEPRIKPRSLSVWEGSSDVCCNLASGALELVTLPFLARGACLCTPRFDLELRPGLMARGRREKPIKWPKGTSDKISKKFAWMKGTEWNWNNWRNVKFQKDGNFEAPTNDCQRGQCKWSANKGKIFVLWGQAGVHELEIVGEVPTEQNQQKMQGMTMRGRRVSDGDRCSAVFQRVFDHEAAELDKDLYEILGLQEDADEADIKKVYRKLSIKYHPDKNPDEESKRKFGEIRDAYEILNDPDKKILYDTGGMEAVKKAEKGEIEKGEDAKANLAVSLEDLYNGGNRKAEIARRIVCRGCRVKPDSPKCQGCNRCPNEVRLVNRQVGPGMFMQQQEEVQSQEKCKQEVAEIDAHIEKGMRDGESLTFPRMTDQRPGMIPGSMILTLKVARHPEFERRGDDLHMSAKVTLREALLGWTKTIRHMDGHTVEIGTDSVTKPFQVIKVRGEGMPLRDDPSSFGDLYVKVEVMFPRALTGTQQDQISSIFS
ncbi:ERDJ3B [Symbiodinium natans]|uniref:ERDJ3B protein n=1 Tax=Symbiodinium natans TaxID=878477 RepID=A0A812RSH8_9DINO|nr:ERDJ3B [Symbiodinium natans]